MSPLSVLCLTLILEGGETSRGKCAHSHERSGGESEVGHGSQRRACKCRWGCASSGRRLFAETGSPATPNNCCGACLKSTQQLLRSLSQAHPTIVAELVSRAPNDCCGACLKRTQQLLRSLSQAHPTIVAELVSRAPNDCCGACLKSTQ
jgi:hypothetical protein